MTRRMLYSLLILASASLGVVRCGGKEEPTRKAETSAGSSENAVSRTKDGNPVIQLEPESQERAGIEAQPLVARSLQPEMLAYGRLEEDPSQAFILRSPIAGTLQYAKGQNWPSLGAQLKDGSVIGTIEPRFTPSERIGLSGQLSTARSELNASTASASAARKEYERMRLLNADNKNVSDRAVEDAATKLSAEEARLKAATETAHLLESTLNSSGLSGSRPLIVERGGDVVEVYAQPGESIEPGSPILRVTRLDLLLARIDVPVGQHVPASVSIARIVPTGFEDQPLQGERVAVTLDPKAQGEAFLFRLKGTRFGLRPGLAVTAYLPLPGSSRAGVFIPRAALVRVTGRTFAYVQVKPEQFVRKEVPLNNPVEGGYVVTSGFLAGERVVTVGAQTLLSEEFKSQTVPDEEG